MVDARLYPVDSRLYWQHLDNPKVIAPFCVAHKKWPCKACGTCHYQGCRCGFCDPEGMPPRLHTPTGEERNG